MSDTKIRHLATPESHEQARQALYDIINFGAGKLLPSSFQIKSSGGDESAAPAEI